MIFMRKRNIPAYYEYFEMLAHKDRCDRCKPERTPKEEARGKIKWP
jgi:hypothetical protein